MSLINPKIVTTLQAASRKRIGNNAEFAKDRDAIKKFLERKQRKTVSLNEAVLRKEIEANKQDDKKADEKDDDKTPKTPPVFRDDHYSNEVLQITLDYIQQLKQAKSAAK